MAKNLISNIACFLGVELGEEFKLRILEKEVCEPGIYKFDLGEGLVKKDKNGVFNSNSSIEFEDLCIGNYEIVKLPCEPKNGEIYWTIFFISDGKPFTDRLVWSGDSVDLSKNALGMVYRSEEEASVHMAEDYERLTGKKLEG